MDSDNTEEGLRQFARRTFSTASNVFSKEAQQKDRTESFGLMQIDLRVALPVSVASFLLLGGLFGYASWRLDQKYSALRNHDAFAVATVDKTYVPCTKGGGYDVEYHFRTNTLGYVHGDDCSGSSDNYVVAIRDRKARVKYDIYNPSNSEIDITGWLNRPTPKSHWVKLIALLVGICLSISIILSYVASIGFGKRVSA